MCEWHYEAYHDGMTKPIRGLTRPENAPEDWRPSLVEMIRHAEIAISFAERNQRATHESVDLSPQNADRKYTPAQLEQIMILRKHLRAGRRALGDQR